MGKAGSKTRTSKWYATARDAGATERGRLGTASRVVAHTKLVFDAFDAAECTPQCVHVDNFTTSVRLLIFLLFLCG